MVKSKPWHYSNKNSAALFKIEEEHLDWKELVGLIGGFLTTMGMVPQVWRLFKLKSAHEISLTFSLLFNIGIVFWLAYGILHGLISVIIWNGITLVLGCGMLYAKLKWGR
jgi:MtN3 and saliva related transmembrane protein